MTDNASTPDLSSPLLESSVAMHEFYTTLLAGGFSKDEAMEILVRWLGSAK